MDGKVHLVIRSAFFTFLCALMLYTTSCAPTTESDQPAPAEQRSPAAETAAKQPAETPSVQTPPVETPSVPEPAPEPELPLLDVQALKGDRPTINGLLDDAAWVWAAQSSDFMQAMGEKTAGKTKFLVTYDADTVYLAVEAFDNAPALAKPISGAEEHDGESMWDGDCVEFFIDPAGKREKYYQFIISPKGGTWDAFHDMAGVPEMNWNPQYECSVKIGNTSWIVEMAVPLAAFNRTEEHGSVWAFNVSRTRYAEGELMYWSAPMDSTSHRPDRFGTLQNMFAGPVAEEAGATGQ